MVLKNKQILRFSVENCKNLRSLWTLSELPLGANSEPVNSCSRGRETRVQTLHCLLKSPTHPVPREHYYDRLWKKDWTLLARNGIKGHFEFQITFLNRFNIWHHLVVCVYFGILIDWQQRRCNNYKWPWPMLIKHWSSDANTIFVRIWRVWQILRGDIWPQPVERYALPAWQCLTRPALVQQDNCSWHLLVRDLAMKKQSF